MMSPVWKTLKKDKNKIISVPIPEQAKKFGIKSGGGMLLYGPPGTG